MRNASPLGGAWPYARCTPVSSRTAGPKVTVPATVQAGDTLLLYSDGVTEAGADCGEDYGEDRLMHTLRANQSLPAEALVQAIVDDVNEFSGAARSEHRASAMGGEHQESPFAAGAVFGLGAAGTSPPTSRSFSSTVARSISPLVSPASAAAYSARAP